MTEEIIIDGINVAGCEFYFEDNGIIAPDGTPERANLCTSPERSCENSDSCDCNKECYYKQLKRLEQENKKLKEAYNEISNNSEILHENNCLRIANAKLNEDLSQAETSMREWKSQNDEARIAYNTLMLDIISDIPFKGEIGGERDISIKDHLHQMQKALASLKRIQELSNINKEWAVFMKPIDRLEKIKKIVNEVLQ